jgi:mannose-6-phosphate isomerase-like protein (cupin superfamily)
MTIPQPARPGALSQDQLLGQLVTAPGYRVSAQAPAARFDAVARRLFGGTLKPLMASRDAGGRFANAALACPPTACTGQLELAAGAQSSPWRNPDAIECIFCTEGTVEVTYGAALDHAISLGKFDMVSLPANVRLQVRNGGAGIARTVHILSVAPGGSFDLSGAQSAPDDARAALGLRFDASLGEEVAASVVEGRVTRFDKLVPYKKDLNRTGGLPAEATESLSAGNVYPLIVPEGHIGRSRTAPMYGNQGLYISVAECTAGTDGPPPHAHSDTQESFYVLDGSFDICTGFDNESFVPVKANDLVAMPNKVMRTFRNTSGKPARLLVIIQGPDRMNDTVSFSRRIGEDFKRRFGQETIDAYAQIRMTFDAEERAGA